MITIVGQSMEGVYLPTMEYRYDEGRLESVFMQGEGIIWEIVRE